MNKIFNKIVIYIFSFSIISFTMAGTKNNPAKASPTNDENPFFKESTLPFQAPPFNKIQDSDYMPAFDEGIKQKYEEVEKIANNPAPPTFENTLIALEKSGQLLYRVEAAFGVVSSANTDSILQQIQVEIEPRLTALDDSTYLNAKLFERIKSIYNKRNELDLDDESLRLISFYYKKFIHAGANLSNADKVKLKNLNEEEAKLMAVFTNKLLEATKEGGLIVEDSSMLAGLSPVEINTASKAAEQRGLSGKWLLPLQNTTRQPVLQSLENREVRKQLFENSVNRAERGDSNDTRTIIERLAEIRAEKAKCLGFSNYAEWKLEDQMAKTPEAVEKFLSGLVPPSVSNGKKEADDLQKIINQLGKDFDLQAWDWNYYAQKLRKSRYNIDESKIKSYFLLENVLQKGVFYAAHELYGLTFKERHDIPVYQKDVRVFEVFDKDGSPLALFYGDYFKRDNKGGGAWMDNIVRQSKLLGTKPVIYNVTNFMKPAEGEPALLSYDDVTTIFHEFGHALHGMFADQKFPSLSGTNVARDFVEFPSQFNENWALYPKILKNYALNYKTGEPIPEELIEKMKKSRNFNQGYDFTETLEAACLDMNWHTLPANASLQNTDEFEKASLKKDGFNIPQIPPRYHSSYFMHIWGNSYSAGYYAYIWTEMLDHDAFDWFVNNGGLTRENGDRFRKMILSRGATEDYDKMFRDFTGHDPRIEPLLKFRGLE